MTQSAATHELEPHKLTAIKYYGFAPETYNNCVLGLEPISDCVDEITKIHQAHWDETEVLYLTRPMDPDYDYLSSMEANRQFVLFTIRDPDGNLIGNLGYFIAISTHFKGSLMAREDFFFIDKAHRGSGLARRFYQYSEECLTQLGVKLIGISDKAPCGGKSLGPLLEREGFKAVSTIYIKEVL